jgi:hypothetical protein
MKNLISKLRHEITCWEEGLTYEEEALLAIHELVRERLAKLSCPGFEIKPNGERWILK